MTDPADQRTDRGGNAGATAAKVGALKRIEEELAQVALSPSLQAKAFRHCEHLTQLCARLQKMGVDNQSIDRHVAEIFGGYKAVLLKSFQGA